MKELQEFNNWATTIVESSIFEAPKKDGPIKREIPQTQDIVYQATRKYPDRDTDQALSLFLADKLEDFDRRDLEQNAVINAQRRENNKLNQNLSKLQQELDTIEASSEQTDAEIQRLKTLSGKLSTDIEQRVISARDIERALAQVEELRNKPGMSEEKYEELKKKIEAAQQNGDRINPEEFKKFTDQMNALQSEQRIEKNQLSQLEKLAADLKLGGEKSVGQKIDLEKKLNKILVDMDSQKEKIENQLVKLQTKETELSNTINSLGGKTDKIDKIDTIGELAKDANTINTGQQEIINNLNVRLQRIEKNIPLSDYEETDEYASQKASAKQTTPRSIIAKIKKIKSDRDQSNLFDPTKGSTTINEAMNIFQQNINEDSIDYDKFEESELIEFVDLINDSLNYAEIQDKDEILKYKIILTDEEFVNLLFYTAYIIIRKIRPNSYDRKVIAKITLRKLSDTWWKRLNSSYNDPEYYKILNYVQRRMDRLQLSARSKTVWNLDWFEDKPIFIDAWEQLVNELAPRKQISTKHQPRFWNDVETDDEDDDFPSTQFGFDDEEPPRLPRGKLEESIEQMVDNIIGEDVARWIK